MRVITEVCFTFSIDGFWIKFDNGEIDFFTRDQLFNMVGEREYFRINKIANSLAGHWHTVVE